MSTAYFPIISCDFFFSLFLPFFSSPLHTPPPPPMTFIECEQFCISALTGNKSFYQERILMDSMLHLSHQNLNCIIFNFLRTQNQSFFLRVMFIRVVEELVLQN